MQNNSTAAGNQSVTIGNPGIDPRFDFVFDPCGKRIAEVDRLRELTIFRARVDGGLGQAGQFHHGRQTDQST